VELLAASGAGEEVVDVIFLVRQRGQGLVEYALILMLVALIVIVILALLGPAIGNIFSNVVSAI
jgi:pilus assembly protein Flp/PilA